MSKKIIIYSSLTGNTAKVANAIAEEIGCESVSFNEFKGNLDEFDFIGVGFFVDKGGADAKFTKFYKENIKNKKIGVFMTLGAEPDSDHAKECLKKVEDELIANGCEVLCDFACQGAIDPKLIEMMRKMAEKGNSPHPITPEREAKWAKAALHPDEADLANAKKAFEKIKNL